MYLASPSVGHPALWRALGVSLVVEGGVWMSEKLEVRLKAFTYRRPTEAALVALTDLREAFQDFCRILDGVLPESREKSLAFTALEECGHWSTKALTHNDAACVEDSPHPAPVRE